MRVKRAFVTLILIHTVIGVSKIIDYPAPKFVLDDKGRYGGQGKYGVDLERAIEIGNWFCDQLGDRKVILTKDAEISLTKHDPEIVMDMRIESASKLTMDYTDKNAVQNCKAHMLKLTQIFCQQIGDLPGLLGCTKITFSGWAKSADITYTMLRRIDSDACPLPPNWSEDLHCFANDDATHTAMNPDSVKHAIDDICKQLAGKTLNSDDSQTLTASDGVHLEVKGIPVSEEEDHHRCHAGTTFKSDESVCRTGFEALYKCPPSNNQGKGGTMRWNCLYWTIKSTKSP
ncbi:hypothetical protein BDV96DRAFT_315136 [Lophiotrema nucula]|uniref:Uncharacterized protein n=1 Tax=Lophiotrema nucula TaxID=690887 RepID=A0A6A5ZM57_9PLEO|nr:hypothetical protein BDV96DRAFT_315136 [Lophiotrema nucula]